ncbi:hypothetical protein Ddc_20348 [Ditylenchus destructor]|nr:hypothetical protein Ddc_20348 [Ditylenchus destructor]
MTMYLCRSGLSTPFNDWLPRLACGPDPEWQDAHVIPARTVGCPCGTGTETCTSPRRDGVKSGSVGISNEDPRRNGGVDGPRAIRLADAPGIDRRLELQLRELLGFPVPHVMQSDPVLLHHELSARSTWQGLADDLGVLELPQSGVMYGRSPNLWPS